ncbi:MAG: chalcone isomerase family protein [Candidatus Binatia bacterium]
MTPAHTIARWLGVVAAIALLAVPGSLADIAVSSAAMVVARATGAAFPSEVSFVDHGVTYHLTATGVAVRTKFIFKVYSVAHYLDDRSAAVRPGIVQRILSDDVAKQITMEFARDLRADQIRDGLIQSYTRNASHEELHATRPLLDRFLAATHKDVVKGERFVVRWLPGGRLQGVYGGTIACEITNPTFARVFWSMWFGPHPVLDRDQLLARVTAESS